MEENAQQVSTTQAQRTPDQDIEIIFDALTVHFEEIEKLHEEIKRIDATLNTIHFALHSIGNMVAGKVGAKELELLVKQIVEDTLKGG